jgi:hypothetical protein
MSRDALAMAPGRNAAQVIFRDLGLDFERTIKSPPIERFDSRLVFT